MKAVIVAAGQGIRLWEQTDRIPKTLLPFRDGTVLSHILANFASVGVTEFVIVVGYRPEMIVDYLEANDRFGHRVRFVENPEWRRGNGVSVAAAGPEVGDDPRVVLSMSDHLVPVPALRKLVEAPGDGNVLLTDGAIDRIFDLDDATKVETEGNRIVNIGKDLETYDRVDCGIFKLTPAFFRALGRQIAAGRESISDGVRELIGTEGFWSVPIPEGCRWIDIDTPESYRHALSRQDAFGAGAGASLDPTLGADRVR